MEYSQIIIESADVQLSKSGNRSVVTHPKGTTITFDDKAETIVPGVGGYQSEVAFVLLNGAPQYARNDKGEMVYVPTGKVIPEVAPSLKSRYKDVNELLDGIAAENYTRKVNVDGVTLPFTQYGSEPPAWFGSEPGSGDLIEMEVPAIPPTVELPPTGSTPGVPQVFDVSNGDRNGRVFLAGSANTPYVAHLSAAGLKDGYGRFSLTEVPGAATVARPREIALDGKVIEPRKQEGGVSSDVTYQVKSGRFVGVNDVPHEGAAIEASWIGDQSAPFFVEHHPPQ